MINRGSEWRKWDLHFHTPSSYDYKDKSVTNKAIIDGLQKENIAVVAITDHYVIDKNRIQELRDIAGTTTTILPGIEFSSELGGSESIHFIGIFPEKSDIDHIWTTLQGKLGLTMSGIYSKGGYDKLQCDLEDTCDIIHELGGITTVHAGSKSNTVESIKNNLLAKMQQKGRLLSDYIDILELGKEEDAADYNTIVFPAIGLKRPMVICSDNHDMKNYITKQSCWVKADPTFEGLKQLIYEPDERVCIQSNNPNSKLLYNVIDRIKFVDVSGNKLFPNNEIGLNPNLNCIIGGKSSGKSLLLHMLAKEFKLINEPDKNKYDLLNSGSKLEVFYADKPDVAKGNNDKRTIEFLPQQYIEQIVRTGANKTSKESFNEFVQKLILQKEELRKLFDACESNISEITSSLKSDITEWIRLDSLISREKVELSSLGDKTVISESIKRIDNNILELNSKSGLSDAELTKLGSLKDINKQLQQQNFQDEILYSKIEEYLKDFVVDVLDRLPKVFNYHSAMPYIIEFQNKMLSELTSLVATHIEGYKTELESKQKKLKKAIEDRVLEIEKNDVELKPIEDKNKRQGEVVNLTEMRNAEQAKIENIKAKESRIKQLLEERNKIALIGKYQKIYGLKNELAEQINNKVSSAWENDKADLKLKCEVKFNSELFGSSFGAGVNKRQSLASQFPGCGFEHSYYIFRAEDHKGSIEGILKKHTDDTNRFSNYSATGDLEKQLRAILSDYFYLDFDIIKGTDSLHQMSEGKKGIVVLQLYLSLSNSDCPILIDQPEDNLDNRTVYTDLNDYIKQSKIQRQIIMVTHNSNLVVNTDAENIIVANQAGEDKKENREFRFEYVNGPLENTKPRDNNEKAVLFKQGIKEHVCEILEGGDAAFKKREEKYNLK